MAFSPIFGLLKMTWLVILFDRKLQVFKNWPKWTFLGIFNLLLSIQNVSIARFVPMLNETFSVIFKHRASGGSVNYLKQLLPFLLQDAA